MKHTIVLDGSQFTGCIPLSTREAKIKNQAGYLAFDKFTLKVNLGDKSRNHQEPIRLELFY